MAGYKSQFYGADIEPLDDTGSAALHQNVRLLDEVEHDGDTVRALQSTMIECQLRPSRHWLVGALA